MISVIAKMVVQDGKAEQTAQMFKELIKKVATEEGTLLYSINRKPSDENTFVVMERYKDKQALGAHSATAHFKEFSAKLGEVLAAKPEIMVLDELEVITR